MIKKKEFDMGRGDDVKQILYLAMNMRDSVQGYSIKDIQNGYGNCSRRTAMRVKDIISEVFETEEVYNPDSRVKRWRLKKGTLDRILAFSADEIAALEDCQAYMKNQNYTNRCDLLPDIIKKMKFTAKSSVQNDVDALLELQGYAVHQAPKIKLDTATLEKISEALLAEKYLTFRYKNKKGEEKLRKVAPYAVIYSEYTYLVAKDEGGTVFKHFLLYKMENPYVTNEYFEKDETFNLQEHLSKSFGAYQDSEPMKIKLLFSENVKEIIENYSLHPNQKITPNPDGTTTVTFEAGGAHEICWFLFRWGKDVQILEPQQLKDTYKKLLNEVIEQL